MDIARLLICDVHNQFEVIDLKMGALPVETRFAPSQPQVGLARREYQGAAGIARPADRRWANG
jgi:hypothetical protein